MKPCLRLITVTLSGLVLIFVLAGAVYWLRDLLEANGYSVSNGVFLVTLFAVLGAGFGASSKAVLRVAKALDSRQSADDR